MTSKLQYIEIKPVREARGFLQYKIAEVTGSKEDNDLVKKAVKSLVGFFANFHSDKVPVAIFALQWNDWISLIEDQTLQFLFYLHGQDILSELFNQDNNKELLAEAFEWLTKEQ